MNGFEGVVIRDEIDLYLNYIHLRNVMHSVAESEDASEEMRAEALSVIDQMHRRLEELSRVLRQDPLSIQRVARREGISSKAFKPTVGQSAELLERAEKLDYLLQPEVMDRHCRELQALHLQMAGASSAGLH